MAGAIGAANIRLGASIDGLLSGLKSASQAVSSFTYKVNNDLTRAYKQADTANKTFRGGLTRLGDDLQGLAGKMALVGTLPSILAASKAFNDYAELQKLDNGLKRYGETMQTVRELAKLPNIGVFDGAKTLIGLRAVGVESEKAKRLIKSFANAITEAGGSAEDLDPALINIKQFLATGHINQVDLRQLAFRVPQTTGALKNAFGTSDVTKLNELGVEKVIAGLLTELEKIPPVAGGAKTAMEQLGDTFTFFSASMGEGIDKALGVTEAIGKLGDILDNVSTNFRSLTPEAQKSVVALGAIVVVLPAIIGAVGGLIKLLPVLATGFGLISAPIAAAIAVFAVASAAIISNWDSVKAFLLESTWWNTLVGIAKSTLGVLVEVFKVVINIIQGDWSNLGKALVNILKNAANLAINVISGIVKGALGLFGTLNEALGLDSLAAGISKGVKAIDGFAKKIQFDVPDAVGFAKKGLESVKNVIGGTTTETGKLAKANGQAAESYKTMTEAARQMALIDLAMKHDLEQKALQDKIKSYKEFYGVVVGINAELKKGVNNGIGTEYSGPGATEFNQAQAADKATATFGKLGETIKVPKIDTTDYAKSARDMEDISASIENAIIQTKAGLTITLAEGIGDMISGVQTFGSVGKNILGVFADALSNLGKAMVVWAATVTTAKLGMKSLNPYIAAAAGAAAIIAGTVLKNKLKESSQPRFAKGGFAYGEMSAIVGDNPNARFDPEMIAPYSKVDDSIKRSVAESGVNGGGDWSQKEIRISGTDLVVVMERAQKRNKGLRAG